MYKKGTPQMIQEQQADRQGLSIYYFWLESCTEDEALTL